jgi:hypothetical protein
LALKNLGTDMGRNEVITLGVLGALIGMLFNLVLLTVLFGVSPWLSVPMGLVAGAVAPFIGE